MLKINVTKPCDLGSFYIAIIPIEEESNCLGKLKQQSRLD